MKKAVLFSLIFFAIFVSLVIAGGYFAPNISFKLANRNENKDGEVNQDKSDILNAAEIVKHNNVADCWIVISGKVYNITSYFGQHPGGDDAMSLYCGYDATEAYNTKSGSGHSEYAGSLLATYYIGDYTVGEDKIDLPAVDLKNGVNVNLSDKEASLPTVGQATPAVDAGVNLTVAEVAKHNSPADCWMIYGNKVYNITSYFGQHPGGDGKLSSTCGKDGTAAFNGQGHSDRARSLLASYYIGNLNSTADVIAISAPVQGEGSGASFVSQEIIEKEYPGAVITKENIEDDGRREIKFIYDGRVYEVKLDTAGNIVKVEDED